MPSVEFLLLGEFFLKISLLTPKSLHKLFTLRALLSHFCLDSALKPLNSLCGLYLQMPGSESFLQGSQSIGVQTGDHFNADVALKSQVD